MFVSSSKHNTVESPSVSYFLPEEWAFPHEGFAFSLHLLCCHSPKWNHPSGFSPCTIEVAPLNWLLLTTQHGIWGRLRIFPASKKIDVFHTNGPHPPICSGLQFIHGFCGPLLPHVGSVAEGFCQVQSRFFPEKKQSESLPQCPQATQQWVGMLSPNQHCSFRHLGSVCDGQDPKFRLNPVQRKTPICIKFQQIHLDTAGFILLIIPSCKQFFVV